MKTPTLPSPSALPWTPGARVPEGTVGTMQFKPKSLTAAATRISPNRRGRPLKKGAVTQSDGLLRYGRGVNRGMDLTWQQEVFAAFGQVPELHYAINQVARSTAQALIVPDNSASTDGPEPPSTSATSPSRPADAISEDAVYRAAQLANLVGEYYMVSWKNDPDPNNCEIFSPIELVWERNGTATLPRNWGVYDPAKPSNLRVTRVHVPDAAIWERADSAPRAALPILRELIGLTMYVSASIDSRLYSAGIVTYPASAEVASGTTDNPGEFDGDVPLGDALLEAGTHAITNQGTAEARMPILLMLPDEFATGDAVKHITFETPLDGYASTLREENVRRLSVGLDVPVEVLAGMQNSASHFASWSVADDYVRMTIAPLLVLITAGYEAHYERKYAYDTSPLSRRPNLSVEAVQLYDRGVISDDSIRYAIGFTDKDAPKSPDDDFEAAVDQKLWSIVKDSPSVLQTPGLPAVRAQIVAVFKGETPENSIYPGQAVATSADEAPRAAGAPEDENLPDASVPDRDDPRMAPPAAKPSVATPRSDGSPQGGSKGRPHNLPDTAR